MTYQEAVDKFVKETELEINGPDQLYDFLKFSDEMIIYYMRTLKETILNSEELLKKLREMGCDPEYLRQFRFVKFWEKGDEHEEGN